MDDFGWMKQNDNADQVVQRTKKKIVAACDAAMPRRKDNYKRSTSTGGTTNYKDLEN